MTPFTLGFGAGIRSRRKARFLSQRELAELLGMSLKHLGALERGQGNTTLRGMERICLALEWHLLEAPTAEETLETPEPPKMRRSRGGFFNGHRSVLDGLLGVLFAALVTTVALSQPRQTQTPTFRTGVEQIEVSVIARDGSGKFVSDLTMEDFEVFEDGKKQQVNEFALIDLPMVTAPASAKVLPLDVATNAQRAEGRIYLLVLDDLHVDTDQTHSVRRSAREFVERHIGPTDVAAIVTTAGFGASAGEFTQDRARLLKIIDSFMGRQDPTEPASASNLRGAPGGGGGGGGSQGMGGRGGGRGMGGMPGMGGPGGGGADGAGGGGGQGGAPAVDTNKRIQDMKAGFDAMKSMDVLRRVAEMMSRVPGRRKAVLFFSQGLAYDVYDVMGKDTMYASDVRTALAEAIAAATRANVAFYPIDPRGLAVAGFGKDDADSLRRSLETLRALGDDTGGFAAINNNDYKRALVRVVEENSSYYVLGYHPSESKQDGRFHKITVKVRRPGINIVARPGYTAPDSRRVERDKRELTKREKAEKEKVAREQAKRGVASPPASTEANAPDPVTDQLADLLGTPISVTGLAMRMQAAPFKGSGRKASVLVTLQIDGAELPMLDKDGRYRNKIQIALIAIDDRGRIAHSQKAVADLAVPDDESIRLRASGVRWVTKFDLEPGRFHVRLAASEAILGKNGSVLCDVEVPDFEREDRSISGLLLTSNAAALSFTQGWDDVKRWDLPAPITATRVFVQNDVLFAALELYEGKRPPRDHTLVVQIRAADGAVVQRFSNTFKAKDLKSDRYVPYLTLPLNTLSPGQYVLQVEARPAGSRESPLTRALSFEVLPRPSAGL